MTAVAVVDVAWVVVVDADDVVPGNATFRVLSSEPPPHADKRSAPAVKQSYQFVDQRLVT